VENLDSGVGVYAPDAEAYEVFAPLFDPIIEEYHGGSLHIKIQVKQCKTNRNQLTKCKAFWTFEF
jgi:hypothetical protein